MSATTIKPGALPKVSWYDSPWKIAGRAVAIAIATVLVLAALAIFAVPRLMGGTSLTILSGSMEPSLMPGDVIAVRGIEERDVCTEVGINDIITFFAEPNSPDLITHRVVAKTVGTYPDGTNCRLVVQGDNNTAVDAPISPAQVRGVFMYGVPAIGWARDWFAQNPAIVIGGFIAVALAVYAWGAIRGPKTRIVNMPAGAVPGGVPMIPSGFDGRAFGAAQPKGFDPAQPPIGFDSAQPPIGFDSAQPPYGGQFPAGTMLAAMAPPHPVVEFPDTRRSSSAAYRDHEPQPATTMDPNEFTLRMRELDLREREIAIREAETKARLSSTTGWLSGVETTSSQDAPEPQLLLVP